MPHLLGFACTASSLDLSDLSFCPPSLCRLCSSTLSITLLCNSSSVGDLRYSQLGMDILIQKNAAFTFPSLDSHGRFIRLLQILPGEPDDNLNCSLRVADLDDGGTVFTALSYTWGLDQSQEIRMFYINHQPFHIFANLHDFLCQLRARSCDHDLFADAISINQADVEEKNKQVALMGQIYTSADRVFEWLGREGDGSGELIDHLNVLSSLFGKTCHRGQRVQEDGPQALKPYHNPITNTLDHQLLQTMTGNNGIPGPAVDIWETYLRLLKRPYWNRIWIVQELLLAQNEILLLCGDRLISWSVLSAPADYKALIDDEDNLRAYKCTSFCKFSTIKAENKEQSLEALLSDFGQMGCTDVRDRVFAFLGLLRGKHRRADLQPNYSITHKELFCKLVAGIATKKDLLHFAVVYLDALQLKANDLDQPNNSTYNCISSPPTVSNDWIFKLPLDLLGNAFQPPRSLQRPCINYLFKAPTLVKGHLSGYIVFRHRNLESARSNEPIELMHHLQLASSGEWIFYHDAGVKIPELRHARSDILLFVGTQSDEYLVHSVLTLLQTSALPGPSISLDEQDRIALHLSLQYFLEVLEVFEKPYPPPDCLNTIWTFWVRVEP